jgi:nucleoside-diphosphate-sugar epimerase
MKKRLVITGTSGFVGSKLESALSSSHQILSIDRVDREKNKENDFLNHDIRKHIIELPEYKEATVIHAAAVMNANNIKDFWEVNVLGTKNILDWAIKHKAKHFILISSGSVYGYARNIFMKESDSLNPIGAYGYSKWLCENLSQMYYKIFNLPITILRLYFPYGPNQEKGIFNLIIRSIEEDKPLTIKKNGSPQFQPLHIDDLTAAIIKVISNVGGFNIYNLCGDTKVSFLELVYLLEKNLKKKAKLIFSDDDEGDLLANNTKIKNELNWCPVKSIVDGIRTLH